MLVEVDSSLEYLGEPFCGDSLCFHPDDASHALAIQPFFTCSSLRLSYSRRMSAVRVLALVANPESVRAARTRGSRSPDCHQVSEHPLRPAPRFLVIPLAQAHLIALQLVRASASSTSFSVALKGPKRSSFSAAAADAKRPAHSTSSDSSRRCRYAAR